MASSPGRAVSDRESTERRLLTALLLNYSSFASWAISEALRVRTAHILEVVLQNEFQSRVIEPTIDAATPAGFKTEQALAYYERSNLISDLTDVLAALRDYADAKNLSKRATRNLLRNALDPSSKVLARVPEELLALSGKGAPKLLHPRFPFTETGMSYADRFAAQARTLATGSEAWSVRRQAEFNDDDLRWVTMRDNKVRPAHVHAQGQTVPPDEPFYVGGYPMWFPGDPSAPDDLTVNCRCVLVTVEKPERRWVQRYVPNEWLNASGAPAQARAPRGTPIGGQWIDTPGAILRSLNRLESGTDLGENMRPVEEMRAERRRLAAEVLEREGRPSLDETAARVTDIYDMTTPEQRAAGKAWYEESTGLAQEMVDNPATDLDMEQAAAAIAHLSTQTRWEANAEYARALASGMNQDEALAYLKGRIASGAVPRPRMGGDFLLGRNWEKAQSAMGHDNPVGDNSSFGTFTEKNKTRTFASNILGDQDGVTVDVHMQRVLGQSLKPIGKIKGMNQVYREDQIYESLAEAVRVAADARGITPAEMQAITWTWALASHKAARGGNPGRLVDATTGRELPEMLAAAVDPLAPDPVSWENEPMPDYHYAQAERLVGLPRQEAPELSPPVRPALTAAVGPTQARAPKGSTIGGQWIDTPSGLMHGLGWAGEAPGTPERAYTTPDVAPPGWDATQMRHALTEKMPVTMFTEAERLAVEEYTMNAFTNVNTIKRGGPDFLTQKQEAWGQDVSARLDTALAKSVTPGDLYVYRGAGRRLPRGTDADSLVGQVIADKSYLSTSIDPLTGNQFAEGAVLKIAVPKGTHAIWADRMSLNEGEMEVILPPSTPLAITGVSHESYLDWQGNTKDRAIIEAVVATPAGLTAAITQARAPKGTSLGGQWIDTPSGLLQTVSATGETLSDEEVIAQAIGQPGGTRSYAELAEAGGMHEAVNPGYDELTGRRYNCAKVAMATELHARGYAGAVAANEPHFTGVMTSDVEMVFPDSRASLPLPNKGAAFEEMVAGGPGARYIVMGNRTGGDGHAWNAEVTADGDIREFDNQSPWNYTGPISGGQSLWSDYRDYRVIRVDDVGLSSDLVTGIDWGAKNADGSSRRADPFIIDHDAAAEDLALYAATDPRPALTAVSIDITTAELVDEGERWRVIPAADNVIYDDRVTFINKASGVMYRELADGSTLTASAPNQARAPKGSVIGGQWIDTPSAIAANLPEPDWRGDPIPTTVIGGGRRALYAPPLEDNSPASALQANPSGDMINCQRTTTVYEMRRRGMDVVANSGMGENVGATKGLGDYFSTEAPPTRLADVIPFTDNATGKNAAAEEYLTQFGPNTRGSIQVGFKSTGGGHVFNWEVDGDGRVHYMDAQVGREIVGKELTATWNDTEAYSIRFQRLDNVRIGGPARDVVDQSLTPLYSDPEQAAAA